MTEAKPFRVEQSQSPTSSPVYWSPRVLFCPGLSLIPVGCQLLTLEGLPWARASHGIPFPPVHCMGQMNLYPASSSVFKTMLNSFLQVQRVMVLWSDPPYPTLPCYPLQIPREEGIKHSTGKQRVCIPALQRTCWDLGGHLTLSASEFLICEVKGLTENMHFSKNDAPHFSW